MLQNGGNAWLGMLYGETAKLGWGKSDPHAIWKLWDTFGMTNSEMIGYWDPACPVHTPPMKMCSPPSTTSPTAH